MASLDSVVDFDLMTHDQKKLLVEDLIKKQIETNNGPLRSLCLAMFSLALGMAGAMAVQRILIPDLLAKIDGDKVANALTGKMTFRQVCDVLTACIDF